MILEELRNDLIIKQKKGLPFICASVVIWFLILIVLILDLPQDRKNMLVFCCSCPLMPISWLIGKLLKVDIFDKSNSLSNLGFLFTCNQFLYLLIVMWVFSAVSDKMVMVYAMVFGAHLLPYSWLYKSISYRVFFNHHTSCFTDVRMYVFGSLGCCYSLSSRNHIRHCLAY